jgi:hypothetical protein
VNPRTHAETFSLGSELTRLTSLGLRDDVLLFALGVYLGQQEWTPGTTLTVAGCARTVHAPRVTSVTINGIPDVHDGALDWARNVLRNDLPRHVPEHVAHPRAPLKCARCGAPANGWNSAHAPVMVNNEVVWRHYCKRHKATARTNPTEGWKFVRTLPHNSGGLLRTALPDIDVDQLYAWAVPGWADSDGRTRPALLRLVTW